MGDRYDACSTESTLPDRSDFLEKTVTMML